MIRALLPLLIFVPLFAAPNVLKIRLTQGEGGGIVALPLEQYVASVLGGEGSVFRSTEALKAMAVAARTYAVRLRGRHSADNFDFCGTTHCQRVDLRAITARLQAAAEKTAGEMLWFEGKPAFACYTQDCGGMTENAAAVWPGSEAPYLKSHIDPYCTRSGVPTWQWTGSSQEVTAALRHSGLRVPRTLDQIVISGRTPSGRARTLLLSGNGESVGINAGSFRFAVGRSLGWSTVRSNRYEVISAAARFVFQGSGAGHGAGLCQRGADQMGSEGRLFREILAFYYPETLIGLTARGLTWVRMGGESLAVLTTQPDLDRSLLAQAERLSRSLTQRTNLLLPREIEIRLYPDIETFRNATGEPGWVTAHTAGNRIHLQPISVLRSRGVLEPTLRHELLHVLLESQAAPELPVWFREGLVGFLENRKRGAHVPASNPDDAGLRQVEDAQRARRAYMDAALRVAELAERYGEATVLTWLKRGLPPELKYASSNQAPTKSR